MTNTIFDFYNNVYNEILPINKILSQIDNMTLEGYNPETTDTLIKSMDSAFSVIDFIDADPLLICNESALNQTKVFSNRGIFKLIIKYLDPKASHSISTHNKQNKGLTRIHGYKAACFYKIMTNAKEEDILLNYDNVLEDLIDHILMERNALPHHHGKYLYSDNLHKGYLSSKFLMIGDPKKFQRFESNALEIINYITNPEELNKISCQYLNFEQPIWNSKS